ncbi:MAG: FadR/GntR family transcriptional regulator [Anaerolineae bacterium]
MPVQTLSRAPLTNRVIQSLRDMIWRGELAPGDLLPSHEELAARYGVGLSTIREAMKALSLIGLVEVCPGRGTQVLPDALRVLSSEAAMRASLGEVDTEQVLEARTIIETTLTALAAERATQEDLAEINAALAEMQAHMHDDTAFARADLRFHLAVARASKNDILAQMYYLTRSLLEKMVRQVISHPGVKERAVARQIEMAKAIEERDPIRAQEVSKQHTADIAQFFSNETSTMEPTRRTTL